MSNIVNPNQKVAVRAKHLVLFALAIVALGHCCRADSFVGRWQTETNRWSAAGHTNNVESVETIEFFQDLSFKITEIMVSDGKRWTNIPYIGTYTILGTNQARLKLLAQDVPLGATPPSMTVSCYIVGNQLRVPKLTTSVVPEYKIYRRAR